MDADEIEIVGDLGRDEARSQAGAIQAPVHEADRNQVVSSFFRMAAVRLLTHRRAMSGRVLILRVEA